MVRTRKSRLRQMVRYEVRSMLIEHISRMFLEASEEGLDPDEA